VRQRAGEAMKHCDEIVRVISANVLKGVHELIEEAGIQSDPDDILGDRVARKS
jgi:hypothetical protein